MTPTESRSPYQFVQQAVNFGIDPIEALRIRYRYLLSQVEYWLAHDDTTPYYFHVIDTVNDLQKLVAYAKRRKAHPEGNRGITDDMVQAAMAYPMDQLFTFVRGRTKCPFHNSKMYDLSYHAKSNTVRCFGACGKHWNPIHICVERDGMTFPQAVRFLQ